MKQELTLQDILEAINDSSTLNQEQFNELKTDVNELKTRVKSIEATMVTKSYLDDKLGDLRGDLVVLARKGNMKLATLIEDLEHRKILDHETARRIMALEPFPEMN